MIGTKLRQKKSQASFFFAMYGMLALAGGALAARSIRSGQSVSGVAGFMIVFGLGMAVNALIRSRKAQVSVHEDFVEVKQSRTPRTLRYRNMTAVSRPDKNRLVVTLREDGGVRNEVIWLKELDPVEVDKLHDFLVQARGKRR
jgi:hypothetical protein